jgi:hypothetical protein
MDFGKRERYTVEKQGIGFVKDDESWYNLTKSSVAIFAWKRDPMRRLEEMRTITIKVPEELAIKLEALDSASMLQVLERGLKVYETEQISTRKSLKDYLKYMQTDDIIGATRQAKEESQALLEDQGIAMIALLFSDMLSDILRQSRKDAEHASEAVKA